MAAESGTCYIYPMVAAVRQQVTIQAGGRIEVQSPELTPGLRAEVIVLVDQPLAPPAVTSNADSTNWRRFAGAIDSGNPNSSDNDKIDADLTREYGSSDGRDE